MTDIYNALLDALRAGEDVDALIQQAKEQIAKEKEMAAAKKARMDEEKKLAADEVAKYFNDFLTDFYHMPENMVSGDDLVKIASLASNFNIEVKDTPTSHKVKISSKPGVDVFDADRIIKNFISKF